MEAVFIRRALVNTLRLSYRLALSRAKHQHASVSPSIKDRMKDIPSLSEFMRQQAAMDSSQLPLTAASQRKAYIDVYGCQMNVQDTEVIWRFLRDAGYEKARNVEEANAVFLMTCSIREGAERKIWNRLKELGRLRETQAKNQANLNKKFTIGVLGCMAERLKDRIFEKCSDVDIVCGPDAYRDLPRLLNEAESGHHAINVQLSLEETYADVRPVRLDADSPSAYVSIMRGCDNMCTYCIVPFTRGRERSRPSTSIIDEVRNLVREQGVKEIILLGQNVNSYVDKSQLQERHFVSTPSEKPIAKGFRTIYKPKAGQYRFAHLLDDVASVSDDVRVRFTSPHPKDFSDDVLRVIAARPNVSKCLHLPAQSGSNAVLERMRRGYTREAYLELVQRVRELVPGVVFTSDFIAGFCGETDEDHAQTVSLLREVRYSFVYCFPFSVREKTKAFHRLVDDVPDELKRSRHEELTRVFREIAEQEHRARIGNVELVLVEGASRRSSNDLAGRCDTNTRVIFAKRSLPQRTSNGLEDGSLREPTRGEYVAVRVTGCSPQVLHAEPLYRTTLSAFSGIDPTTPLNVNTDAKLTTGLRV